MSLAGGVVCLAFVTRFRGKAEDQPKTFSAMTPPRWTYGIGLYHRMTCKRFQSRSHCRS